MSDAIDNLITDVIRREAGYSSAIKMLQVALGVVADGDVGPATERAVIAFQKARGLAADGVAGPKTLSSFTCWTLRNF